MSAPKASTAARGYGSRHQTARKRALAAFTPGQPCARCGQPIHTARDAELDHDDTNGKQDGNYLGLSHRHCNRAAGARKATRTALVELQPPHPDWLRNPNTKQYVHRTVELGQGRCCTLQGGHSIPY